jgi:hypothetical protein
LLLLFHYCCLLTSQSFCFTVVFGLSQGFQYRSFFNLFLKLSFIYFVC